MVLVSLDPDGHLGIGVEDLFVCQGKETDLVEGVGGVGDELTQEHGLVLVEGVDDELHHTVDLGLELVLLRLVPHLLHLGHVQTVNVDGFLFPATLYVLFISHSL